ncbi:hypothetical protein [Streptomyces rimosus]|uniref:hypothetical protein n=1 Tax=Streptomyces rimosus TaxID=1927 RepID=UPI0037A6D10C
MTCDLATHAPGISHSLGHTTRHIRMPEALPSGHRDERPTDTEPRVGNLHQHTPGTLPRHAPYLHQRTADHIGSLARLIRQAAITDGTERITETTLDAIQLDHLTEQHARPTHHR